MGFLSKLGRLNYGTSSSGGSDYQDTSTMSTQTPAYNQGIQTLTNTYVPPTNIDQQAADQVMRAGQTNVAAQNLANQQAATYANMFGPRTTQATPTEDTTDVGTGGDDTSGTDTSGTVNTGTTSADGGVTTGGVATTTNTGLTTQDLINDYLQSQGISMDSLNNPAIDYYNIGNPGFIPGGFDPFNNNTFFTPMNTIDFSSLPDGTAPQGFAPIGIASLGE
jgi:hypothetical protein